jgi:hypothetical protein
LLATFMGTKDSCAVPLRTKSIKEQKETKRQTFLPRSQLSTPWRGRRRMPMSIIEKESSLFRTRLYSRIGLSWSRSGILHKFDAALYALVLRTGEFLQSPSGCSLNGSRKEEEGVNDDHDKVAKPSRVEKTIFSAPALTFAYYETLTGERHPLLQSRSALLGRSHKANRSFTSLALFILSTTGIECLEYCGCFVLRLSPDLVLHSRQRKDSSRKGICPS